MATQLFTPTGVRPTGFDTMPSNGSGATKSASSASDCGRTPSPTTTPTATPEPTAEPSPSSQAPDAPTPTAADATPSPAEATPAP